MRACHQPGLADLPPLAVAVARLVCVRADWSAPREPRVRDTIGREIAPVNAPMQDHEGATALQAGIGKRTHPRR